MLALVSGLWSQTVLPERWSIRPEPVRLKRTPGLTSNIISEIRLQGDSLVWFGTSRGLALMRDSLTIAMLDTLQLTTGAQDVVTDGISAIAVSGQAVLVATATRDVDVAVGGGLYYTTRGQDSIPTWTYYAQPVDQPADSLAPFANKYFRALPVTTDHTNVTYDASIGGGYLWIASWGGGLRRFDLTSGQNFDRVPLPPDDLDTLNTCDPASFTLNNSGQDVLNNFYLNPRDPGDGGNHNHKAFSVLAYGDTVWVGTANGINRGILGPNGCIDWQHYRYPQDGLSGNWVVSIARQQWNGERIIWAVTLNADSPGEQRGLSYTRDDGETWHMTLLGERAYNVVAVDSIILAATENGLWRSDDGENWALYQPAHQLQTLQAEEILSNTVFSAAPDTRAYYPQPVLWLGTPDGIARSRNFQGQSWTIFRAEFDPAQVYAYPNPFSPLSHNQLNGDGYVRIHTDVKKSYVIDWEVYNFALEKVYQASYDRRTATGALKWDGRDSRGRLVANGVYFIRLKYDTKTEWLKLIVVK
ncbi:MAG: hypothetical protein D6762_07215 [Candidatus Neomarinimicrobiota bacterium]|nr:MAG: hypothetical protein D6762_07215 [Candidatus Neomarinimicrobiota bacterium]